MSQFDTTALARIMLGGFNQGAGMVSNAAQISDARQREAAMQQRYAQEVAYRQQQQQAEQARQLAQMSALANFAEQRGLLQQPQMPPQGSSPVGPFQPGMEPQQAGPSMGLDRQTLMGMEPTTARSVVDDMMLGQRQMENARFDADLKNQLEQRAKTDRAAKAAYLDSQLERAGFTPEQRARARAATGMAELGTPAGTINQMFEPQVPGADWSMAQGLGYPDAMQPAFAGGQITAMDAWKNRPDTADAEGDPDAQMADFIRSVEGPFADPANPETWTKLNPTGVEIMRLKMRRGEAITDQVLSAVLPESDGRTKVAFLKWQADQMGQRYRSILNASTYDGGPSKLDVANAETAWVDAARAYGQVAMGQGGGQPQQPGPQQPAEQQPEAQQSDLAMIARQLAERMFPGVPVQALTPQQKQQIADQLNALNGGQ